MQTINFNSSIETIPEASLSKVASTDGSVDDNKSDTSIDSQERHKRTLVKKARLRKEKELAAHKQKMDDAFILLRKMEEKGIKKQAGKIAL